MPEKEPGFSSEPGKHPFELNDTDEFIPLPPDTEDILRDGRGRIKEKKNLIEDLENSKDDKSDNEIEEVDKEIEKIRKEIEEIEEDTKRAVIDNAKKKTS